jgi:uncharacterized protein with HEPN domain
MSRRDDRTRLKHMLDHAVEAVDMIKGRTRNDLDLDRRLNLALVRLLEVMGEAANRITKETQIKYPKVKWQEIIGLRNRLIHGYDEVDFNILWDIVKYDLPTLIEEIREILTLDNEP